MRARCCAVAPRSPRPDAPVSAPRAFGAEYLRLREAALRWIRPYRDRRHLERAADWALSLDPGAGEPLLLAALTHDMERSLPGGPVIDKAATEWDDRPYNDRHCERSADVVAGWLLGQGAGASFVEGVREPILRHEFGGGAEGDLMQAADSLSFLDVNGPVVAAWVLDGECDRDKGQRKLDWMLERIRHEPARATATVLHIRATAAFRQRLDAAGI
jgi:hypothetical protein